MELSPDSEIVFQKSPSHQNPRQTLTITNNLTEQSSLAFKVKTTAPKQFVVRPNSGKLAPGEKIDITIVLQLRDGSIDTKRKDKFLVQSIKLSSDVASLDENSFQAKVGDLWNLAEQSKKTAGDSGADVILEKKIKCIYALDDLVASSTSPAVAGDSSSAVSNNRPVKSVVLNEVSGDRRSVFEEVDSMTMKTPDSTIAVTPATATTANPAALDKALKELRDSKEKIISLQSACDGYKQELERLNVLRQRRADASVPPTSTANSSTATKSHKSSASASGVNFQALMLLCFLSFILGAWLF